MPKESARRHHYIPRCYLKRFSSGKKHRLHVEEIDNNQVKKVFFPNTSSFLVECGIYDLSEYIKDSYQLNVKLRLIMQSLGR